MTGELSRALPNTHLSEDTPNEISGSEQSQICKRIPGHFGAAGSEWRVGKEGQQSEVLCAAGMEPSLKTQSNRTRQGCYQMLQ